MCFVLLISLQESIWGAWSVSETVDSTGVVGRYNSICLDRSGDVHISYYDSTNGHLKYAKKSGTVWAVSSIDLNPSVGKYSSIAIDSDDNPHISYYDEYINVLKYAFFNGSSWNIMIVDANSSKGKYSSLAIDSEDNPHISYYDEFNTNLKYAKWEGSSFSISFVDTDIGTGSFSSIALDKNNLPHIAYADKQNLRLKYARYSGSEWVITPDVDPDIDVAEYISIDTDSSDNPHISYYDAQNKDLKYSHWNGALWSRSIVEQSGEVGEFSSLKVDSKDHIHISYADISNTQLRYAYYNGSEWSMTTLDDAPSQYSSLDVYYNDNPYICYFNSFNEELRFIQQTDANPPLLSWTGEQDYESDGLDIHIGSIETTFTFQVSYSDIDNDPPSAGDPKLQILAGGTDIAGSPFTMAENDSEDDFFYDGKTYNYAILLSSGSDYSYSFSSEDDTGLGATGDAVSSQDGPVVSHIPFLTWPGGTGYLTDGLDPETGVVSTTFTYKVIYTDQDNDQPLSGYPLVHIIKESAEIPGSPHQMSFESGDMISGATFSFSLTLPPGEYEYYFECYDKWGLSSTGDGISQMSGPSVSNFYPELTWTDEVNYSSSGVYPHSGSVSETFVFRVMYTDLDDEAPLSNYPEVHIIEGAVEIDSSPVILNYISGAYNSGAKYSAETVLPPGDFQYFFEAYDIWGQKAIGTATVETAGLTVINPLPVISWTGDPGYLVDGVDPDTGDISTLFTFQISYRDDDNEHPYAGYPRLRIYDNGLEYPGSPYIMSFQSGSFNSGAVYLLDLYLGSGDKYSYIFEAEDKWGQNAITDTAPLTLSSGPEVSTAAMEELDLLLIYPNPSMEYIYFENLTESGTIDIYDISGAKVLSEIYSPNDIGQKYIEVGDLSPGIYVYHVKDGGTDISRTGKFALIR